LTSLPFLTSFKERGFESYSPTLVGKGLFLLGLYCSQQRNAIITGVDLPK
jgi:hypothetical protein